MGECRRSERSTVLVDILQVSIKGPNEMESQEGASPFAKDTNSKLAHILILIQCETAGSSLLQYYGVITKVRTQLL